MKILVTERSYQPELSNMLREEARALERDKPQHQHLRRPGSGQKGEQRRLGGPFRRRPSHVESLAVVGAGCIHVCVAGVADHNALDRFGLRKF